MAPPGFRDSSLQRGCQRAATTLPGPPDLLVSSRGSRVGQRILDADEQRRSALERAGERTERIASRDRDDRREGHRRAQEVQAHRARQAARGTALALPGPEAAARGSCLQGLRPRHAAPPGDRRRGAEASARWGTAEGRADPPPRRPDYPQRRDGSYIPSLRRRRVTRCP